LRLVDEVIGITNVPIVPEPLEGSSTCERTTTGANFHRRAGNEECGRLAARQGLRIKVTPAVTGNLPLRQNDSGKRAAALIVQAIERERSDIRDE
jgi:hypothetical protein